LPFDARPVIASAGRADLIDATGSGLPDPASAAELARLYDLDLVDEPGDLDLYLALAARMDRPILELAAGSGRLSVPLARAGYHITGVDLDPAMLHRARARARAAGDLVADRLTLVEADLIDLRLPAAEAFGLAVIALNSLLLLPTRAAQQAAFRTLAAHLSPGGLAVVDVWIPDADELSRFDGRISLEWVRRDPETGTTVTKTASAQHDASSATVDLTTFFEQGVQGAPTQRWIRHDRLRFVAADELRAFAEEAGLVVELMAGDYGLGSIGPGSERAILVAVKP
jgi:SAM-dependent methyltransferase